MRNRNYIFVSKYSTFSRFVAKDVTKRTAVCVSSIFENAKLEELSKEFAFTPWAKIDETHTAVRFVTSLATKRENVEYLLTKI